MSSLTAKILIVEDDELSRELLKRRLEVDHHHITTVSSGVKALNLLKKESFDFILLDISLPDIDGVTVLDKIKNELNIENSQVMMVTSNSEREMVVKCMDAGAVDYLVKPYSTSLVKLRISRCLKNKTITTENKNESTSILLVDDQELNRDVLAHRLNKYGYNITNVSNGQEALDILDKEDFDLVLLDIMMPDISGIEVLTEIRNHIKHKNTPVIMITAVEDIKTVNECINAGADDYITKPINNSLLKYRLKSCLHASRTS